MKDPSLTTRVEHPDSKPWLARPRVSRLLIVLGAIGLLVVAAQWQLVAAATKTWTGAGATENWSLGANWSGGTVPVAADTIVFDATSTKNVIIDVNVSVVAVTVSEGYTGTISQAVGRTVTVGASGWSQADGAFVGGTSTITINGPFSLSGGSFTATAGTMTVTGNLTHSAGAFVASSGTITLATSTATIDVPGSETLNNLTIASGSKTIAAGDTLVVTGSLVLTDGTINIGAVEAHGPISQALAFDGGTATMVIAGVGDQTFTGFANATTGLLPNVIIAKPSGTLSVAGTIRTARNWTYTTGGLNPAGSTMVFAGGTITGSHALNAVDLRATTTLAAGSVLTVQASLTLTAGALNGTGIVDAQGSISQASTSGGGTATVRINGSVDQTLTGTATATAGLLPNVIIVKPSGTLTLTGTIRTASSWTYTSGAFDAGGSTVVFAGTQTVTGSHTLNAVEVRGTVTVAAGTTVTVTGSLTLTSGALNTGTVEARGPINQSSGFTGTSSATLLIAGTADQTFTGTATPTAGSLPNVVINKPSGTLTLAGTIRTTRNWTLTSGTLDTTGATLVFAGNQTVTGSMSLTNLTFNGSGATYTLTAGTTLTVAGALVLTDGSINTGTVEALGSISQAATFDGGTGTLLIAGTADQTFTGTATPTAGSLPNVVINKPSGTLTLAGTIRTTRNWTLTSGTLDTTGATLVFAGNQTVTGSMSLTNLTFNGSGATYTLTAGTTLTVAGALVLTDGAINTGTVEALGSISQATTFDGGTGTLLIAGTADQTFTGTATPTAGSLPNVVINKPSGTLTLAGTIRTTRNWTLTAGTLDTTGATLVFAGGIVSGDMAFPNLEVRATTSIASGTTLVVTGSLILTSGSLNGPGALEAHGSISQASTFAGGTTTLLINGTADQTFTGAATVTAGNLPIVVIDKPSGTLTLVGTVRTASNWSHSSGAVAAGGATLVFAGGIVSAAGMTFGDVEVRTGTVTLGSALDVAANLRIISGTLNTSPGNHAVTVQNGLVVGGTLRPNGSTVTVNGDVTINGAYVAGTSTLVLSGAAGQVLGGAASPILANLTIDDAGGVSLGTSITLTGTLTLIGGQFSVGAHVLGLSQPIAGTPTNLSAGATSGILVTGSGSAIVLPNSVGVLGTLTLANPSGLALSGALTVEGILRFTQGNLVASPFDVTLGPAGTVVRTSGHVIGTLRKPIGSGTGVGVTFEIGDASAYAPISTVFANLFAPGEFAASTSGGEHPAIAASPIDPNQDVNRSWTIAGSFAFDTFDATFTFGAFDIDPGADPASFMVAGYDGGAWTSLAVGSRTSTSTQAVGVDAFGSFALGEAAADLSVVQTASPAVVHVGENLVYRVVISDGGPSNATAVVLTDTLGALGEIQAVTTSQGLCSWTTSTATCALGTVSAGGSATVTIVARTLDVGSLANDVIVTTTGSDTNPADNVSTLVRTIRPPTSPPSSPPTPPTPTPTPTPTPSPGAGIVLVDGIAPGVNRGTSGFGTKSLVVKRGSYVTILIRMDPALAGKKVEIWRRGKAGDWVLVTTRIVAADGTVHYYARVSAWTGFWAKLDGATSHGRIATVR